MQALTSFIFVNVPGKNETIYRVRRQIRPKFSFRRETVCLYIMQKEKLQIILV